VIEPLQIRGLGFDELADHLFVAGRLVREGLRQRCVGRFRFLMKTLEHLGDRAAAE